MICRGVSACLALTLDTCTHTLVRLFSCHHSLLPRGCCLSVANDYLSGIINFRLLGPSLPYIWRHSVWRLHCNLIQWFIFFLSFFPFVLAVKMTQLTNNSWENFMEIKSIYYTLHRLGFVLNYCKWTNICQKNLVLFFSVQIIVGDKWETLWQEMVLMEKQRYSGVI